MKRAKQKPKSEPTIYDFINAAVLDQPVAARMIAEDRTWLTRTTGAEETALAYLVVENYVAGVAFLIERGADVNTVDGLGATPLMFAAQLGYRDMVSLLLQHGARVNEIDAIDQTALTKAVEHGRVEISDMLLGAGADPFLAGSVYDDIMPRKRSQILDIFGKHGFREPAPEGWGDEGGET
jgi:hypothetical protein